MTAHPDRGFVVTYDHDTYGSARRSTVPLRQASTAAAAVAAVRALDPRVKNLRARRQTDAEYCEELRLAAQVAESARKTQAHREALLAGRFGRDVEPSSPVATEVWAVTLDESGAETGYIGRRRGRTMGEIAEDIEGAFKALDRYDHPDDQYPAHTFADEGLSVCQWAEVAGKRGPDVVWPEHVRWVAAYVVTGGSEGHWVHVDLVMSCRHGGDPYRPGDRQESVQAFLCKTFQGREHAQRIAAKFSELLGA